MDRKVSRAKLRLASTECEFTELELAAEQFIKLAGSKGEAHRLITAANAKAKSGRHKGLPYRLIDSRLLSLAEGLQLEWFLRLPCGRPPTRHRLTKKIVELCWQEDGGVEDRMGRRRGCWNREVCERLALGPARLGTHPDATVKRLDGRRPLLIRGITGIDCKYFREFGFLGTPCDPLCSGGVIEY
jgi:hypothetical protein